MIYKMIYMPLVMIEKLKCHIRNENQTLVGRLNRSFLDSHFLRPRFWYILIKIYIYLQIGETFLFDTSFMQYVYPETVHGSVLSDPPVGNWRRDST
jgi:hypothetical protein